MNMFESTPDPFGFCQELKEIGRPRQHLGAINYDDISNCKINVTKITWIGEELKLNYRYGLFSLNRRDDCVYEGVLVEQKKPDKNGMTYKEIKLAEDALVEGIMVDNSFIVLSIQSKYDDNIYDPIYYDKKQKRLINSFSISDRNYYRYIALYDDSAEFSTDVRRIK
jgi:hypothetical protein